MLPGWRTPNRPPVVEQRARDRAQAPVARADAGAINAPAAMPRWVAGLGTAVCALIVQGAGASNCQRVAPLGSAVLSPTTLV